MHSLHSAASYLYTNYENVMSQPGKGFLVWLAGLSVLGFLATDMYLPAFAAMQQDLNTSAASIRRQPEPVPRRLRAGPAVLGTAVGPLWT